MPHGVGFNSLQLCGFVPPPGQLQKSESTNMSKAHIMALGRDLDPAPADARHTGLPEYLDQHTVNEKGAGNVAFYFGCFDGYALRLRPCPGRADDSEKGKWRDDDVQPGRPRSRLL